VINDDATRLSSSEVVPLLARLRSSSAVSPDYSLARRASEGSSYIEGKIPRLRVGLTLQGVFREDGLTLDLQISCVELQRMHE